jgi:hypothetical protein
MPAPTSKRFAPATVTIAGSATNWAGQLLAIQPTNNTDAGDLFWTFGADNGTDNVGREETDPDWSITLRGKADWAASGISRFLAANDRTNKVLTVVFDVGVTGWERTWTGTVYLVMPGDGGDARSAQEFEVTWAYHGKPTLTYAT